MAGALDLDEIRAHALNNIGLARVTLGDRDRVRGTSSRAWRSPTRQVRPKACAAA